MTPADQLAAARTGAAWHRRPGLAWLRLTGADTVTFLQGMVTQDLRPLRPGQGTRTGFTDRMAKLLGVATLDRDAEGVWLECEQACLGAFAKKLKVYVFSSDVHFQQAEGHASLRVVGPEAAAAVEGLGLPAPSEAGAGDHGARGGAEVWVRRVAWVGAPAFDLVAPEAAIEDLAAGLRDADAAELGPEVAEALRIEAGQARFGVDATPDHMPTEVGYEDAVSYSKGCYMGQEILERMRSRGVRTRALRVLEFEGEAAPPTPAAVEKDGAEVGTLTSAAALPGEGLALGLAVLPVKKVAAGDRVEVAGRAAVVRDQPETREDEA